MKKIELFGATALALMMATPAVAQDAPQADETASTGIDEIVVTAQRQSESLQDVPIAVSAFSSEQLEKQQIENASDLQLTLPNVTFSKGNFTGSSFTIRGIGDLCVGNSCDSATAIHVNGTPLLGTRLFETEYFDLERIEVLRGPQGTLFGRNATSGVVNFITAKPDLTGFKAAGEAEYGNFNAMKFKGMLNAALGDTLGVRVAGFYQKRDGYTKNLFDNSKVDGRDMYAVRGSLRWQPSDTTTVDLMGYYFREKDDRARIQKQVCQRDPTGILGCLPNRREFGATNNNSTFVGNLTSREFFAFNGIPTALGLGSLYGPDSNSTFVNPANVRQVRTDFNPEYFTDEQQYQARLEQEFGSMKLQATGLYQKTRVDSRQDYNLNVADRSGYATALNTLAFLNANNVISRPPLGQTTPVNYLAPIVSALLPGGPNGPLCVSETEPTGVGAFGGLKRCSNVTSEFDRSIAKNRTWSAEGILSSDFDGKFNFLLGGIYVDSKTTDGDYYVNAFGIDYFTSVFGSFTAFGGGLPPSFLGTPYFRNNALSTTLKSYGIFGEAYFEISDKLKLTAGIRYNNDKKGSDARSTLASFLVPYGSTSAFGTPFGASFDADPKTNPVVPGNPNATCANVSPVGAIGSVPGCEATQVRNVKFSEWTGRLVLDYQISDDNLLYASFSRGYKSGGINPPLQPIFAVPDSFGPENIDSFEIGSKNTFLDGTLRFNLTAFYYKYKQLQLSRIVARTSVNDNVNANIYGLEAEAIIKPSREVLVNMGFSYLKTKVNQDKFLSNPRDPSGGRADAVVIKDISNGSNCAVVSNSGNVAGVNAFVNAINLGVINNVSGSALTPRTATNPNDAPLQGTTAFPSDSGLAARGAYSICGVLNAGAAGAIPGIVPAAFGGVSVLFEGVPVNIKGNKLPQAPNFKFSVGAQYTAEFDSGMSLVPRVDLSYTGDSYGNIFNGRVNKVAGYSQINAQIQLNGRDDKWFARAFLQNLTNNNATTGLYVTDQSSGLFTNIFTLEPRRYGISAGFKF
jgi:iron complex outermembrane recepter protein